MSVGLSIRRIEEELSQLWEGMSSQAEEGTSVIKASVINLIIFQSGPWSSSALDSILSDVTREHPGRILVILADSSSSREALDVQVTARCYPRVRERKQVCCECVRIEAAGPALQEIPSLVRPLLVPDLPVALWWRTEPLFEERIFQQLTRIAGRTILDSNTMADGLRGLTLLSDLIQAGDAQSAVTDLNWARITQWRRAIAGFFDVPKWRAHLDSIHRLEIDGTFRGGGKDVSVQALLMAGWLGSRLQWKVKEQRNSVSDHDGRFAFEAIREGGTTIVEIRRREVNRSEKAEQGLSRVALFAGPDGTTLFEAMASADRRHIQTSVRQNSDILSQRTHRNLLESESCMICRELEILSRDEAYESALQFVSRLIE